MKFTIRMKFEKETKNSLRFQEVEEKGQAPRIGTLYVKKYAVDGRPAELTVTVEGGDGR